jgi:hypothetical protein
MKLLEARRLGNKSAIVLYFQDGTELLLSYNTIVGVRLPSGQMFVTDREWSQTTTRHIAEWQYTWGHPYTEKVPQKYLDNLLTVDTDNALASLLAA